MRTERGLYIACCFLLSWVLFAPPSAEFMFSVVPLANEFTTLDSADQKFVLQRVGSFSAHVYGMQAILAGLIIILCLFSHRRSPVRGDYCLFGMLSGCITVYMYLWWLLHALLQSYIQSDLFGFGLILCGLFILRRQSWLIRMKT